jgi:nucleoside 2-deoxyribosyltransferase
MKTIYAPEDFSQSVRTVFLAGSIETGGAENWQDQIIAMLANSDVTVLNPRRPQWDNSWEQSLDNPAFVKQVNWELDALQSADCIVLYFDPATKSPISLMELGLFADSKKLVVCCPEGFWRKGNVDIVCRRHAVPTVETIEELADFAQSFVARFVNPLI